MGKADKQLKQVGLRIKNYRELKGFSQEYVASKLHISCSAYSRIERNEVSLSLDKLIHIAEVLNVSLEKIIFGDDHNSSLMAEDAQTEYQQKLVENSRLLKAYQDQVSMLKEQVDYLKGIIDKQ